MLLAPPVSPPTHFHVPDGSRFTIADEVADLMDAIGYQVDDPERQTCRALFPQQPNGDWAGLESGIVAPRQNLKTATMIAGALHDTFVQGVERVVWTAHEFRTSSDAFRDFRGLIESHQWLADEVLTVRTANGKEGFELRNGSRLDIIARTGRSGRGMGAPRLYMDEALYLDGRMMGALVPTMSARANAHMVYGSSPGILSSNVLRGLRRRGRSGLDPNLGWIEWASERVACADPDCVHQFGAEGCWLDDEDAWWAVNPALGRRITLDFVRQERRALASEPVEFLRERMGVWEDPPNEGGVTVFPLDEWIESTDATSEVADGADVSWAVDVSWNRATAYVSAAGRRDDGLLHARVVHYCDPSEVAAWIGQRVGMRPSAAVALQGTGAPVSSLLEEITRAVDGRCPVVAMSSSDTSKACGVVFDAVKSGALRHVGDPALDRSLLLARARPLGDGWALDRKGSPVDIANLVSLVNAAWLAVTHDEPADAEFFVIF